MCVHRLMGQLSKGLELIWCKRPKKGEEEEKEHEWIVWEGRS